MIGTKLLGPTVAAAMDKPVNNFTLVRLGLALAVVLSHAFSVISGTLTTEPLVASTGFTLGEHAVNGFFAVSGFLVSMSFDRRGWRDYILARALRIAPGLIAATLAVALALGLAMTHLTAAAYLRDPGVWRFIAATLTSFKSSITLPGVFTANPYGFPMGTVWTLKYEVLCYGGVLLAGAVGLLRSRPASLALVIILFMALAALGFTQADQAKGVETALRLPLIFGFGGMLYVWRDRIRLSGLAVLVFAALAWLAEGTFLYKAILFSGSAYAVLWLCLVPTRWSREPSADLSYGIYLYGWPVQQTLHALFPQASALALLCPAIILTLAVAALSWHFVESPALRLKARALARRDLNAIRPSAL